VIEDAGGVQRRGGGGAGGAGDPLPGELGAGRVRAARRPRAPRLLPHQPGPPPPKVLTPAIAVDMDRVASLL